MAPQVVRGKRFRGHVIAHKPFQSRNILTHRGYGLFNTVVFFQRYFHLAKFNAVSAHLYLSVHATLVVDVTIGHFHRAVSRPVRSAPRCERVGNEAFSRQVVATDISGSHACAAQVEFSFHALFHGMHGIVQDEELHIVDRFPDGGKGRPGCGVAF